MSTVSNMHDPNPQLFHTLFVTIPKRVKSQKFSVYFANAKLDSMALELVLKRREPSRERGPDGVERMGWGASCSEPEFAAAASDLHARARSFWINIENEPRELDLKLLAEGGVGALLSGADLDPRHVVEVARACAASAPLILALENEAMLSGASRLLEQLPLAGLVVGSSYLSESSKMYDQMGLERYRALMRGACKKAGSLGVRPYTTSNYCTFEPTGSGDKSKDFVAEQVGFVRSRTGWGSITRFYSHLGTAQAVLDTEDVPASGGKDASWFS